MRNIKELWPCLDEPGLKVFATTADQRYELGQDVFLKTHSPIMLRRFPVDMSPEDLEETYLLKQLSRTSGVQPGNRVFVLYGAAGSGKSELMRWLQVKLAQTAPDRRDVTVRIPRTELNIPAITERFHRMLTGRYFNDVTHQRWDQAVNKPRTLAKILLLTALERSLDSDEQINALYYRLLAWIEPRVDRSLGASVEDTDEEHSHLELLTREDLEELRSETALSMPLDYEQFRYHLTQAFQEQLMEGLYLPDTLQRISEDLATQGTRPLLLIDDLVQSINLFATELLDYFITLSSGNWDVVIGLTPSALAADKRGQELLERISYLDTVDDRVEKLWLSDVQGTDSYFLTKASCPAFTARYLQAYRAYNGWQCTTCEHQMRCRHLGIADGSLLAPFNQTVLQRLFQNLPDGKGKARQFIHRLHAILEGASDSQGLLPMLDKYAQSKFVVETDDRIHKALAELYGLLTDSEQEVVVPANLLQAFGIASEPLRLPAEPLHDRAAYLQDNESQPKHQEDPTRLAIKAWLEGKPVNRQSLLPLRRGIARWLREVLPVRTIHARGIARAHKALKWQRVYLSVRPPIVLQDVDEEEGIYVTREIGLTAFRFYAFASATGKEKKTLVADLAREERLLPLLHAADDYRQKIKCRLDEQLGMRTEELALTFYTWLAIAYGVPHEHPPGFDAGFWEQIEAMRAHFPVWQTEPDDELCQSIHYLFDDFFRLRKNVYDGPKIVRVISGRTPEVLLDALGEIDLEQLDMDYRLRKEPLRDILKTVQEAIRHWRVPSDVEEGLSIAAQALVETLGSDDDRGVLLHQVPHDVLSELQKDKPALYKSLRIIVLRSSDD